MAHDLIDTTEMYLKTVFELLELGVTPMRARIAERLQQSGPTVSQTVARMERDGLLYLDNERVIHLSIEGEKIATDVMRKHRLAERHLQDVIGLDFEMIHEEACRWEHVMSIEVERKIASLLAPPYLDPYGNPIPGLAALGIEEQGVKDGKESAHEGRRTARLIDVLGDLDSLSVTVKSIGEVIQSDPQFLLELHELGILPGVKVQVERDADSIQVIAEGGGAIMLSPVDAGHIGVYVMEKV